MRFSDHCLMIFCAAVGGLCFVPLAKAQKENSLVVPGESVGEVSLGMQEPDVGLKLGQPATGEGAAGTSWGAWFAPKEGSGRGPELDIRFNFLTGEEKERVATAIRLESTFFHTKEGINTRSSLAEIWKAFPSLRYDDTDRDDKAVERYADAEHGIAIEVRRTRTNADSMILPRTEWGICQAIIVFTPDGSGAGLAPNIRSMRNMPDN